MSGDLSGHPAILNLDPEPPQGRNSNGSLGRWLLGAISVSILTAAYWGVNLKLDLGAEALRRTQAMEIRMAVQETQDAATNDKARTVQTEMNRRFDEVMAAQTEINRKMDRILLRSGARQGGE